MSVLKDHTGFYYANFKKFEPRFMNKLHKSGFAVPAGEGSAKGGNI